MADMSTPNPNAIDLRTYFPPTNVFRPRPEGEATADVSPYTADEVEQITALTDDEKIALLAEDYWRRYEESFAEFADQLPSELWLVVTSDAGTRTVVVTPDRKITKAKAKEVPVVFSADRSIDPATTETA